MAEMIRWAWLLLAVGCGGAVSSAPAEESSPVGCSPPAFAEGACREDVLNDGAGPDDHRKVCTTGDDTWILYPSREQWQLRGGDGGNNALVVCHSLPDGGIAWRVDGG